jgi:hypothetical protein
MAFLTMMAGVVIGAVAAWYLMRGYGAEELRKLRVRFEERIGYWQSEAERAKICAAQLSEQTAAWVAGCQQGREDVLSLARALAQRPANAELHSEED